MFTLDGKYLAFLSNRTFDPVYDAHMFDLGFLPGTRPYLVTLAADTPSPFAPELNGRPAKQPDKKSDKAKAKAEGTGAEDGKKEDDDAVEPVRLDLEGLAGRVVPFPVQAGNYHGLKCGRRRRPLGPGPGHRSARRGFDRRRGASQALAAALRPG